jgi:putative transposase
MPRTRRHIFAGTVYHVLNRGNERARIFHTHNDYRRFIDLMEEVAVKVPMRVIGYDVMPNHVHLLLWPEADDSISRYMHRLTGTHALQLRFKDSTVGTGHVYQGRFKCFPVQTEEYYFTCQKYVEDNAHRAGLVARAELWQWSSLYERLHGGRILSPGPLPLPERWPEIVNLGPGDSELDAIRTCARGGRPYGSAEWVDQAVARHGLEARVRPRGRPRRK